MPQLTPPLPRLELSKLSAPVVEEGGRVAQPHTPIGDAHITRHPGASDLGELQPRSLQRFVSWPRQPARSAGPTSGVEVRGRLNSTHLPQLVARPAGLAQRSMGPPSIAAERSSSEIRASYGAGSRSSAASDQLRSADKRRRDMAAAQGMEWRAANGVEGKKGGFSARESGPEYLARLLSYRMNHALQRSEANEELLPLDVVTSDGGGAQRGLCSCLCWQRRCGGCGGGWVQLCDGCCRHGRSLLCV